MPEAKWHNGLTLRKWRLKNFKSVPDAEVELAPLTVVVGANSAGKSTLLQSIRVAAQAASSDSEFFPLNAEHIRVGTFDETRSFEAKANDPIEIGGSFFLGDPEYYTSHSFYSNYTGAVRRRARRVRELIENTHLDWDVSLLGAAKGQSAASNVVGVRSVACVAGEPFASVDAWSAKKDPDGSFGHQLHYKGEIREGGAVVTRLIDANVVGGFPRAYLRSEALVELLLTTWFDVRSAAIRATFSRRLALQSKGPSSQEVLFTSAESKETAQAIAKVFLDIVNEFPAEAFGSPAAQRVIEIRVRELQADDSSPLSVEHTWSEQQLAEIYEGVRRELSRELRDRRGARVEPLPEVLADALADAREFLATRVQHLGPLRMDPKVVYTSSPAGNPGFIGAKGEYTASVLETSKMQRVVKSPVVPGSARNTTQTTTLLSDVNKWAEYLQIGEAFSTQDRGRLGLQLSVRQPGASKELDLTSVGTGVSQILPVLVMCLQAPPGSLLLIEQPELHLNPAVQQRLADFLIAVVETGRQVIVETHSDYLVNRLRRRTAEDQSGTLSESIALVFAEREDGATSYKRVRPPTDGSMTDWPIGFFDDAAEDSKALLEALLGNLKK